MNALDKFRVGFLVSTIALYGAKFIIPVEKKTEYEINGWTVETHEGKLKMDITGLVAQCYEVEYTNDKKILRVYVDGLFNLFTEEEKKIILTHELGHAVVPEAFVKPGDMTYDLLYTIGITPKQEYYADNYAVQTWGYSKVRKTLEKMLLISNIYGISLISRIAKLGYDELSGKDPEVATANA